MGKSEMFKKLFLKQWVIGLSRCDIKDVIRTKTFNQDITWLPVSSKTHFYADPFLLMTEKDRIEIIFEDFSIEDNYGNISLMTLDKNLKQVGQKILLDTKSHLSFPFIFSEEGRIFVFPESARRGAVSCYEYRPGEPLHFVSDLVRMPLYDPAILKKDGKYWLFGSLFENRKDYKLHIFFSEKLTGPYTQLGLNPAKSGLDGVRAAGNFIEVDGAIYRPAQNCGNKYGESITINRILKLDEQNFSEEAYMKISINNKNQEEHNVHTIHTLNSSGSYVIVDGTKWTFSLTEQWKNFRRNRKLMNNARISLQMTKRQ